MSKGSLCQGSSLFSIAPTRSKINLLIYAPDLEVIIQWITH